MKTKFPCQTPAKGRRKFLNGYVIYPNIHHFDCICDFISKYTALIYRDQQFAEETERVKVRYVVRKFDAEKREYHLGLEMIDQLLGYRAAPRRRLFIAPQNEVEAHCDVEVAATFREMADDSS